MKGTSAVKEVKNGEDGNESSSNGSSKKAKKGTYEKQLDDINKELNSKSVGTANGKGGKKQKMKPEQELILLEQKSILLLKLKRNKEVVDDGYSTIGRMGPNVVIYKCILIALVRLGKSEDDIIELLDAWKKSTPKCSHMLETKRKFDGYLTALRSGMKYADIFNSIEEALGLNAETVLSKQFTDTDDNKWKFRAPPPRHTTFSLCPRATSGNSCIYGEECLFAHSQEELKEWKMRVDVDKKDSNVMDESVESGYRCTKKRPIPNVYRSLLIPPLCIHYLLDLGKKIKDAADVKEVLVDEIQGIKLKEATPLKYQRRIDGSKVLQCTWSFLVGCKMPMGTVSILHDANRENFKISSAVYYNKKKEPLGLIELHPNNKVQTKLQVLNTFIQPSVFLRFNYGWPEMCYYKVEVMFESNDPFPEVGLYRQSIVFDFKKDPKIVKHISVEILPELEAIENHFPEVVVNKSVWATTPAADNADSFFRPLENNLFTGNKGQTSSSSFSSQICDFPSLSLEQHRSTQSQLTEFSNKVVGLKRLEIVDSDTGVFVKVPGVSPSGSCDNDTFYENLFVEDVVLTKENYGKWMRDFLDVELTARQKSLYDLKKTVDVKLFEKHALNPDGLYKYPWQGEIYGKFEIVSEILCDTKLGKLINGNCNSVLICSNTDLGSSFRRPFRRYLCKVVEKLKSAVIIAIGRMAADELLLLSDSIRQLQVQFVLDPLYIEKIRCSLDRVSKHHMETLFPTFENNKLPFLKVIDSIGLLNEEEVRLNTRQLGVYNLLTGRNVLLNDSSYTPPILLTGPVSTGKTYLLAHCLRALLRSYGGVQPNRILVTTQSDFAADIFITEFLHRWLINDELSVQRSKPLRVYDADRCEDTVSGIVKHYCLFNNDGTSFRYPTKDEVMAHKVIIVTLSNCAELIQLGLDEDTFSHVIIDEATHCLEAECIQPILLAGENTKVVIAGDVMQTYLGMFASAKAALPMSILERVRNLFPFRHPFVVNLIENYTNHEVIVKFISEAFYHDQLCPASNQPSHPNYYPLSFHHIPSSRELISDNGGGYYNMEEIRSIVDFAGNLLNSWPEAWGTINEKDSIVVVTPYANHIMGLRVQLQVKGLQAVQVEMASNILGKRFRVAIISTVRTYKSYDESLSNCFGVGMNGGFFSERQLINTAVSCAKSLVAVFGDALGLWSHGSCRDIWRKFITECHINSSFKGFSQDTPKPEGVEGIIPTIKENVMLPTTVSNESKLHSRMAAPFDPRAATLGSAQFFAKNSSASLIIPKATSKLESLGLSERSHSTEGGVSRMAANFEVRPVGVGSVSMLPKDNISNKLINKGSDKIDSSSSMTKYFDSNSSWNIKSTTLNEAPKTDLFSAFGSNMESLYSQSTPVESDRKIIQKPVASNIVNKIPSTFSSPIFEPLPVDGFRSPFELPSVATTNEVDDIQVMSRISNKAAVVPENNLSFLSSEPMPLPTPTIPSHMLYDRSFMLDNGTKFHEAGKSFGFGNSYSSPQKFTSPLLRGPPGFTPVYEHKLGNLPSPSSPEKTPQSPYRGGVAPKYRYKRNTYELPPRMQKNLYLLNNSRPTTPKKAVFKPVAEMNFFEELGLEADKEISRSGSSTSSDDSFIEPEETIAVVEEDYPNLSSQSDWIEVKNTRKSKNQPTNKKGKSRDKLLKTDESVKAKHEMCMDDKIELITQMGFSKSQATKALQSCEKDLQRAVDWLISKPTSNKSSSY